VAGLSKERRQHVPKAAVVIHEENATTGFRLRHVILLSEGLNRSVMLAVITG
jgi:hypothetical protein